MPHLAKTVSIQDIQLLDFEPRTDNFKEEVLTGLGQRKKSLPCKFFYDAAGCELFDQICDLPEYYPTRTELQIMQEHVQAMADCVGPNCRIVELGSGSGLKTRLLLRALAEPHSYVPVEIAKDYLLQMAGELQQEFPQLLVQPVCADFSQPYSLPEEEGKASARTVAYFPGSTIGNLKRPAAEAFLRQLASLCGAGGGMLLGTDMKKDASVLEAAYDDAQGVTAAFNLNLLTRINRELGGNFQLEQFQHLVKYEPVKGRVETRLLSLVEQDVQVAGQDFHLAKGETIHTENSHKYSLEDVAQLAQAAGFKLQQTWSDAKGYFSLHYLSL